jgi:hypothetical protein
MTTKDIAHRRFEEPKLPAFLPSRECEATHIDAKSMDWNYGESGDADPVEISKIKA